MLALFIIRSIVQNKNSNFTFLGINGGYLQIDQSTGEIDIDASDPDTYTITYTADYAGNPSQCSLSVSTTLTIHPSPKAALSGSNTICLGGQTILTATLTGTAPFAFTYSTTDNANNTSSTTISGIQTSAYTFTVSPNPEAVREELP